MKKLQKVVNEWQDEVFGEQQTPVGLINHLREEVEELDSEIMLLSMDEGTSAEANLSFSMENIRNELADIIILTCGIARLYDINLESSVADKMAVNKNREWDEMDDLGIIHHI